MPDRLSPLLTPPPALPGTSGPASGNGPEFGGEDKPNGAGEAVLELSEEEAAGGLSLGAVENQAAGLAAAALPARTPPVLAQLDGSEAIPLHTGIQLLHLENLLGATDSPQAAFDQDSFVGEVLQHIALVFGVDSAALWMMEEDGRHLNMVAARGLEANSTMQGRLALGHGLPGRVALRGEFMVMQDLARQEMGNLFFPAQILAAAAAPLKGNGADGKILGVLSVGSAHARQFSAPEAQLLSLIAQRVAAALGRSRLFDQARNAQEQLESLSRRVLEVQENERRHIARELHDDIGQSLTAVKIGLLALTNSEADTTGLLEETLGTVDAAIARVRNLSRDLRPAVLDDLGLAAALRWLIRGQKDGTPRCHVDGDDGARFSVLIETVCFRVAQEAFNNALRHAEAQNIWISFTMSKLALTLSISDDGKGFDMETVQANVKLGESLGLLNMEERVRLAGGRFTLLSRPGRGTKVRAVFPRRVLTADAV